jgi:hypothetical protein
LAKRTHGFALKPPVKEVSLCSGVLQADGELVDAKDEEQQQSAPDGDAEEDVERACQRDHEHPSVSLSAVSPDEFKPGLRLAIAQ